MTPTKQLLRVWAGAREAGAGAGRALQQMNLIMIINHHQTRSSPNPRLTPDTGTDTHCFLLNIQSLHKRLHYLGFDFIKYEMQTLFELRTLQ